MDKSTSNGNGPIKWPLVFNGIMIIVVVLGGWWGTVYGPITEKFAVYEAKVTRLQNEIDAIHSLLRERSQQFPTHYEYREMIKRLDNDIINLRAMSSHRMTREEFAAWKLERDTLISSLLRRMEALERRP